MLLSPRYEGPPIISIVGEPDDQLAPVVRQRRRFEAMLASIDEGEWSSQSRCEGWTVQDVVAHLIGVNDFWAASVRAGLAGEPTQMLRGFDPAATPPLLVEPMRALAPREVFDRFVASNDAFLDAIGELDDRGWAMLAECPVGHVPIRLLAHHALWDCWVHERDVALPLERTAPAVPDEVGSSLRYVAALGPAFAISAGRKIAELVAVDVSDPTLSLVLDVGESVAVREGAAPPGAPCLRGDGVMLLEALSLRVPLPASTPPEWVELLRGLAMVFDVEL